VAGAELPPRMRRLVTQLNGLIDGDVGRVVADDRHFSASGVTGEMASDEGASAPEIDNSLATPVEAAGAAPAPQIALSCYGHGDRASGSADPSQPVTFRGLTKRRAGRVTPVTALVQPGAVATVSIAAKDRDRAGLLFGRAWEQNEPTTAGARHTIRFEGCSDATSGGGPARFEGGLAAVGRGCVTLLVYAPERERRRVACR
jgi:hypothetical protein